MRRMLQGMLCCVAVIVVGIMLPRPASAVNIVENPGFENSSFSPWVNNPTVSGTGYPWFVSGFQPHSGNQVARTGYTSGATVMTPDPASGGNWLFPDLPTTAGGVYG